MGRDHARASRANPTTPENRLWNALRGRRLGGYKFRQQHEVEGVRPDFFCPAIGLIVEVDGHTHDAEEDAVRDGRLLARGLTTLRFTNTDIMDNLEGVCLKILAAAQGSPPRVWGGGEVR